MAASQTGGKPGNRKLFTVGTVGLLALGAFLFVRDYRTYQRLGEQNDALTGKIREAQRQIRVDIPQAREHLAVLEEEQEEFRYHDRLPDEVRNEELFDRLSEFERLSGIDWQKSTPEQERATRRGTTSTPYETLKYRLELKGTFFEVCRYINLIETMPRFATIEEFSIKPAGREASLEQGGVECTVKLTLSVYRLKPSSAPSSGGRTARS